MINLLPTEAKDDIKYGRLNVTLMQYTTLVVVIVAALVSVLMFGVVIVSRDEKSLRKNIDEKQAILNDLAPVNAEAKALKSTIVTISKLLDREVQFSELIQEIGGIIPNGASLQSLTLTGDETKPLQIQAKIGNQALAAVLRENLESSSLFKNADIQSVSGNFSESGQAVDFQAVFIVSFEDKP